MYKALSASRCWSVLSYPACAAQHRCSLKPLVTSVCIMGRRSVSMDIAIFWQSAYTADE